MKAIFISSDAALSDRESDSFRRMLRYAELLEYLYVVNLNARAVNVSEGGLEIVAPGGGSKFSRFCRAVITGIGLVRRQDVTLVVSQDPKFTGLCTLIIAKFGGCKSVVSVYGSNIHDPHWLAEGFKHRVFGLWGWLILSFADGIQTDGYETLEDLQVRYGAKVYWKPVVPTHIEKFRSFVKAEQAGVFRVFFNARLVGQKNIPLLVDVIARCKELFAPAAVHFTILGDGPERSYLHGRLAELGLDEMVTLIRKCRSDDVIDLYANADALLLTSRYEGFPRVFMEAAAAGLPIVTTRVSGIRNLIEDGVNGFVTEQGAGAALAHALHRLSEEPELYARFSKNIRDSFWNKYGFEATLEQQDKIFKQFARI